MDDIPFDTLAATVVDIAGQPIAKRMRAMFYLRTIGTPEAVRVLCQALEDKAGSCLYRHELAYVLGQMRDATAVPALTAVLEDVADDVIVRHEVRASRPCTRKGRRARSRYTCSSRAYATHSVQKRWAPLLTKTASLCWRNLLLTQPQKCRRPALLRCVAGSGQTARSVSPPMRGPFHLP